MKMVPKSTIYYGKKYWLVCSSDLRRESDVYAHILNNIFADYGKGVLRVKLQKIKRLILIDHCVNNKEETHSIYIRYPFNALIKRM